MLKSHTIVIISTFHLPMPGAAWRRLSYFAEYFSLKGWKVFVLGAFSPTREFLKSPLRQVTVKRSGKYALLNLQLRLDLLGWLPLIVNILGSLPVLIVALVLRPDVLLVSIPWHDVLPMAYATAKLSGSKLIIDVRDPLEYWLHVSRARAYILSKLLKVKLIVFANSVPLKGYIGYESPKKTAKSFLSFSSIWSSMNAAGQNKIIAFANAIIFYYVLLHMQQYTGSAFSAAPHEGSQKHRPESHSNISRSRMRSTQLRS